MQSNTANSIQLFELVDETDAPPLNSLRRTHPAQMSGKICRRSQSTPPCKFARVILDTSRDQIRKYLFSKGLYEKEDGEIFE